MKWWPSGLAWYARVPLAGSPLQLKSGRRPGRKQAAGDTGTVGDVEMTVIMSVSRKSFISVARAIGTGVILHISLSWAAFPVAAAGGEADPGYRLKQGDKLSVTVFGEQELSGEFTLDQFGNMRLAVGGDIPAGGLTVVSLERYLTERLAEGFLKSPQVRVRLSQLPDVYVSGMVRTPGSYGYRQGLTVASAVALAGGMGLSEGRQSSVVSEMLQAHERVRLLETGYASAVLKRARLIAQVHGRRSFDLPEVAEESIRTEIARLREGEQRILASEQDTMDKELELIKSQLPRIEAEVVFIQEQQKLEERQRSLHQQQLQDYEKLMSAGLGRKPAYIDIKREEARLEGNVARLQAEKLRADLSSGDISFRLEELNNRYQRRIISELQDVERVILDLSVTLPSAREIRDARARQIGALSSDSMLHPVITVMRVQGRESLTLPATMTFPVQPGDIVHVGALFDMKDSVTRLELDAGMDSAAAMAIAGGARRESDLQAVRQAGSEATSSLQGDSR